MASVSDPLFIEYEGWFGVSENDPGNRLFTFKRQFLASIRAALGFIEIKSKTRSSEVVRLSTSHLVGKPFTNGVVVWLRYRPRGRGDWQEVGIRADSHQKAQELREFLVKTACLPRAAAPPASPAAVAAAAANVAAAAPTAAAVVVPAADLSSNEMQQPPTASPSAAVSQQSQSVLQQQRPASSFQMQQLLGQSVQQPPSPLVQQLGAVPSSNSAIDTSSFLQTPAPPPLMQPNQQQPQSQFPALLQQLQQSQQQQQQPAFCNGSMGTLGNASMGNFGGANFGNYCVAGAFGAQPQQQPQRLALGTGDDPEYARFAAEFRTLALRVDLLPPEKRRMAITIAQSITGMMCGM